MYRGVPSGPKEALFGLLHSLFAWVRPCYMGRGVTGVCVCGGGGAPKCLANNI